MLFLQMARNCKHFPNMAGQKLGIHWTKYDNKLSTYYFNIQEHNKHVQSETIT